MSYKATREYTCAELKDIARFAQAVAKAWNDKHYTYAVDMTCSDLEAIAHTVRSEGERYGIDKYVAEYRV